MTNFPNSGSWDWTKLTEDVVTNLLLYGQDTTPKEIFDRIVPSNGAGPTIVTLDMASFMSTGPGRFALPSLAPFVQKFFGSNGGLPPALRGITGTYNVQQLISMFGIPADWFKFTFEQRAWQTGAADYGLRTY